LHQPCRLLISPGRSEDGFSYPTPLRVSSAWAKAGGDRSGSRRKLARAGPRSSALRLKAQAAVMGPPGRDRWATQAAPGEKWLRLHRSRLPRDRNPPLDISTPRRGAAGVARSMHCWRNSWTALKRRPGGGPRPNGADRARGRHPRILAWPERSMVAVVSPTASETFRTARMPPSARSRLCRMLARNRGSLRHRGADYPPPRRHPPALTFLPCAATLANPPSSCPSITGPRSDGLIAPVAAMRDTPPASNINRPAPCLPCSARTQPTWW